MLVYVHLYVHYNFLCDLSFIFFFFFFFFQAEDGIRDWSVTGVQTCALPIWRNSLHSKWARQLKIRASGCARWWGRSSKGKRAIRLSNLFGEASRRCACTPRAACRRSPTASWMWTARCVGALDGNSDPSK